MFESKKHVFWQALLVTAVFFIFGLVLGVYLEQMRADDFNTSFYNSEISLYDSLALSKFFESNVSSCGEIKSATISFADRIYEEARSLEKVEEKSKLTESSKSIHRKYDLLRTLLWMNIIDAKKKCGTMNSVVYLYENNAEDIQTKSEQAVWSRILGDLKEKRGNEIVLIPIAVDNNLASLDSLIKTFNVTDYPAVIVNENSIVYGVESVEDIEKLLK